MSAFGTDIPTTTVVDDIVMKTENLYNKDEGG